MKRLIFLCVFSINLAFGQDSTMVLIQDTDSTALDTIQKKVLINPINELYPAQIQPLADVNYNMILQDTIDKVENVPNNRLINDSRVSDPHYLLTQIARDTLDKIMKLTEEETQFQMAVVCLNSIGENDPHVFATDLFNFWGLGDSLRDDGLLIMVVNDIHRVSIITGRFTESILTDLEASDIQDDHMIPFFKKNDYVTGVVRGTQAIASHFYEYRIQ